MPKGWMYFSKRNQNSQCCMPYHFATAKGNAGKIKKGADLAVELRLHHKTFNIEELILQSPLTAEGSVKTPKNYRRPKGFNIGKI